MSNAVKVLAGGCEEPKLCPNCGRRFPPGRRHKDRPGGEWCDGQPNVERDRSLDLLGRVHEYACDLHFEGRFRDVIVLLSPLERLLPRTPGPMQRRREREARRVERV